MDGHMTNIIDRVYSTYEQEGGIAVPLLGLKKLISKFTNDEKSLIYYYNINRLLRYRTFSPPSFKFNNNLIAIQTRNTNTFFGFYDITPFSKDNQKVLYNSINGKVRPETRKYKLNICCYDLRTRRSTNIGQTTTWNWQKGCRLRWHPTKANCIVYNKKIEGNTGAIVKNIKEGGTVRTIDHPLYDICPSGNMGISINFERLEVLQPDYGFITNIENVEDAAPVDDGVFLVDLNSNSSELILSFNKMAKLTDSPKDVPHYVMNIMFSPDGNKISFLHRYWEEGKRYTNLLYTNILTNETRVIEQEGEPSHPAWRTKDQLICTVNHRRKLKVTDLMLYDLNNSEEERIEFPEYTNDTHPSFNPVTNEIFVGDSYPNKYGERELRLFCTGKNEIINIGYAYGPVINNVKRDLHPRWDRKGRYVCVDMPLPDNKSSLFLIEVNADRQHNLNSGDTRT